MSTIEVVYPALPRVCSRERHRVGFVVGCNSDWTVHAFPEQVFYDTSVVAGNKDLPRLMGDNFRVVAVLREAEPVGGCGGDGVGVCCEVECRECGVEGVGVGGVDGGDKFCQVAGGDGEGGHWGLPLGARRVLCGGCCVVNVGGREVVSGY